MMIDLETLDTTHEAVVLSVGAVVWDDHMMVERFSRVLDMNEQTAVGRTINQYTLIWWLRQDRTALQEAFSPVRVPVKTVIDSFNEFASGHMAEGLTKFWAGPATFDFPIWENLCKDFGKDVPWSHKQRYDLRTAVSALGYSVKKYTPTVQGMPHIPVHDCERQIGLLNAARTWRRDE